MNTAPNPAASRRGSAAAAAIDRDRLLDSLDDDFDVDDAEFCRQIELSGMIGLDGMVFD
jgi:hypothetical protein